MSFISALDLSAWSCQSEEELAQWRSSTYTRCISFIRICQNGDTLATKHRDTCKISCTSQHLRLRLILNDLQFKWGSNISWRNDKKCQSGSKKCQASIFHPFHVAWSLYLLLWLQCLSELSWRKFETQRLSFECVIMKAELFIGYKVKSKKKGAVLMNGQGGGQDFCLSRLKLVHFSSVMHSILFNII